MTHTVQYVEYSKGLWFVLISYISSNGYSSLAHGVHECVRQAYNNAYADMRYQLSQ